MNGGDSKGNTVTSSSEWREGSQEPCTIKRNGAACSWAETKGSCHGGDCPRLCLLTAARNSGYKLLCHLRNWTEYVEVHTEYINDQFSAL